MRTGFVHVADVHLGTEQYGSMERADDFGRQWERFARWAVEHRDTVSMALVAGDLFNKYNIDPITYSQAKAGLRLLRDAGIQVLDIEGNHDRHRRRGAKTWLEDLADDGLLYHLDCDFEEDASAPPGHARSRCQLLPLDRNLGWGGYVDLDGVRVVGMHYMGASTSPALDALVRAMDDLPKGGIQYTILMLHGGMEGIIPGMSAELTEADLAKLAGRVDYLALGHIHKSFQHSDWVFNPGSLEVWRADEAGWDHGFYYVLVDTEDPRKHSVRHVNDLWRRRFLVIRVDISSCASPADLYRVVRSRLEEERQRNRARHPVVNLVLEGTLRFDRRDMDYAALVKDVDDIFSPIARKLTDNSGVPRFAPTAASEAPEGIDRHELEQRILREIHQGDARYQAYADEIARLSQELKHRSQRDSPEEMAGLILERWRALRAARTAGGVLQHSPQGHGDGG